MTDTNTGTDEAPAADNTYIFDIPNTTGEDGNPVKMSIDLAAIPADTRMELLRGAVRTVIVNRVNVANVRANKALAPFVAYDEAIKADPLQSAVAKPEGERPAPADLIAKAVEGREALLKGELRSTTKGERKSRAPKDPLDQAVTNIVVRELFAKNKAADTKYTFPMATKAVGGSGIAYLNTLIDAKVEAGADRAALEKFRDQRYIDPARIMIGDKTSKALGELPSIL